MKDLQYITHDLGARNDPKLLMLQMEMGGQGLAIFWCLVEMLWENDGRLPLDPRPIAFSLRWATAEEVDRVIREFGLFENDGDQFWSRSALERIAQKKERLAVRENSARNAANVRWGRTADADAMRGACESNAGAMPIKIDRYIDKQKESNNTPLTAAEFFVSFFFGNVKDPGAEANRFVNYYADRGWKYQDGTPVTDTERAAKDWKPLRDGNRWDGEALRWYRAIWNAAESRVPNALDLFLCQLTNITRKGQRLALRFKTEGAARTVAAFIADNDLSGDWTLDYRVEN